MVDGDGAALGQVDRAGTFAERWRCVEQAEQLRQRRARRLQRVEELRQLLDGFEEVGEIENECGDGAHRPRRSWWTSMPPTPTTAAVVATPASSMIGK